MKLKFAIALCLIVSLLCACGQPNSDIPIEDGVYSENESYKMYIEDGKWYIEFFEPSDAENNSSKETSLEVSPSPPVFDSAADMKEMLTREELPDSLVQQLKAMLDGRKRLELSDPNKICELRTPKGVTYNKVILGVNGYYFRFRKGDFFGVVYCSKASYDWYFEKNYLKAVGEDYAVHSDTTTEDRSARVVHSSNANCEQKKIFYTISSEKSEIIVVETYVHEFFFDVDEKVSETVPYSIELWGSDGTNYWYGCFYGFEERPSVEWLSSFRLVPIE